MRTLLVVLVVLASGYKVAQASNVAWQMDAASCTPESGAIHNHTYSTSNGAVNQTGVQSVWFRCPVPATLGTVTYLEIVFKDSTGGTGGSTNHIEACLWEVSRATGNEVGVLQFDSSGVSSSGIKDYIEPQNPYGLDPINYTYYMSIELYRNNTSNTETVYSVGLRQ